MWSIREIQSRITTSGVNMANFSQHDQGQARTLQLQQRMQEEGIEIAIFSDESAMAYLAGFWGYLSIEFGRPSFLLIREKGEPTIITPLMETEMVSRMTWVENIRSWEDSGEHSWSRLLNDSIGDNLSSMGVESSTMPGIVRNYFVENYQGVKQHDISALLAEQRLVKSEDELQIMSITGEIAQSMMAAAHESLGEGVPEYESALAVINAGTRKAASFLTDDGLQAFISPMIHNLQIMQSGKDTSMVHRRASVKKYKRGDPVYFCFCNMAEFQLYKLGFDRMFFIGEVNEQQAHIQKTAIAAQQAAISIIQPGIKAEDVAKAANAVYQQAGYETGYRTGRAIGMSYLEVPELKIGDETILQAGMTFAVDGGLSIDAVCGGRIGDSIVITENGFEYLTNYSRELLVV